MKDGFIFVYQDVRGRYMSEGDWVEVRPHNPAKRGEADIDESTDTCDTIDWLVKHVPCNNGRVGMWGISYRGFYVAAGMIDAHPALKAASPQAPVTDYYLGDDSFHNGAFMLAANFGFYAASAACSASPAPPQRACRFDYGTPDGYEFYLQHGPALAPAPSATACSGTRTAACNLEHTTYDEFWKARVDLAALQEHHARGAHRGRLVRRRGPGGPAAHLPRDRAATARRRSNQLVMGPWTHGGWSRGDGARGRQPRLRADDRRVLPRARSSSRSSCST